ncbi:MAG: energy transducer TonB [Terracidiphilus sp.]|jgi:TonB family protein
MNYIDSCLDNICARPVLTRLMQTAALTILIALAVPANAAEERGIQMRAIPAYPALAARMKITGSVKVEATVDSQGNVTDAKAISGNSILMPAAEDSVRRWQFNPGKGTVKVEVEVTFHE